MNNMYKVLFFSFVLVCQIKAMNNAGTGSDAFHSAVSSAPWRKPYVHVILAQRPGAPTLWTIAYEQGTFTGTTVYRSFKGKVKENEYSRSTNSGSTSFTISPILNEETNRIQKLVEAQKIICELSALIHIDSSDAIKVVWQK